MEVFPFVFYRPLEPVDPCFENSYEVGDHSIGGSLSLPLIRVLVGSALIIFDVLLSPFWMPPFALLFPAGAKGEKKTATNTVVNFAQTKIDETTINSSK
jgi:hypothetical protein